MRSTGDADKNTTSMWLVITDWVVYVIMAIFTLLTILILLFQHISPAKIGVFSVLALTAPIVYLIDIVIGLYWLARLQWKPLLVMSVVLIIGAFYAPRYYASDFSREHDKEYSESRFTKILTYNVHGGLDEGLVDQLKKYRPDIACLQEVSVTHANWMEICEKYNTTYRENNVGGNCQIFTRHRILRSGQVGTLPRQNGVWADIIVNWDTIRVINLHLRSTAIRNEDTKFLEQHEYIHDEKRTSKLSSIISRLTENNIARAEQAKAVAAFLKETKRKVILAGDFNDIPLSYTYRTIKRGLKDSFSKAGGGYAYTYDTAYRLLRIDNVLLSRSIDVESYEVDTDVSFSDHFPVIVRVKVAK